MKRFSLLLVGLAAAGMGCQDKLAPGPQNAPSAADETASAAAGTDSAMAMTFVSLKVPNMV